MMRHALKSTHSVIWVLAVLCLCGIFVFGCRSSGEKAARPELEKARRLIAHGNYTAAFVQLNQALAEAPRDPDVHLNLGWLYLYTDDPRRAEVEWRKAQALDPTRPEVYHLHGALLADQAKRLESKDKAASNRYHDEAILNFREALRHDSKNEQTYFDLATSLLALNRNQEALDALDQGFDYIPREDLDTQIDFQIASCSAHAHLGMYDEAIADCRQARDFTTNPAQKQRIDDMVESMKLLNPSVRPSDSSTSSPPSPEVAPVVNDSASD